MKRTFAIAAVVAALMTSTSIASAQTSSSAIGVGTGIASAGGGSVGDIISLPGSASVGGAYGVDCTVVWMFGQCKTMRERVMMELLDQMIGAGTTNHAEARAVQLAIAEELGYTIVYRQVGGETTPSSRSPEPAAVAAQPTAILVLASDGTQRRVESPAGVAALRNGEPLQFADGATVERILQ